MLLTFSYRGRYDSFNSARQGTSDTRKAEMVTPGESQGLEILLDRHSDRQTCKRQTKVMYNAQYQRRNSFCHGDRIQGHDLYCSKKPSSNCFQVHLGHPTEFPSLKSRHFNLAPGKRHSIEISATKVTEQCQGQGSNMRTLFGKGPWIFSFVQCPHCLHSATPNLGKLVHFF